MISVLGVPFSLTILGFWFQQREQKRAGEQAKLEKEIAEVNQGEEALQAYFDRLSTLLADKNLIAVAAKVKKANETAKEQPDPAIEEQRELLYGAVDIIRARTLSILRQFGKDKERKGSVIRFLLEAEVINKLDLNLSYADLSEANFSYIDLSSVKLGGANLNNANFKDVTLIDADLRCADLSDAILKANLLRADLSGANLSGADLSNAYLKDAYLNGADLKDANLSSTDLNGTRGLTEAQLSAAKLCKTQLPAGCNLDPNRDCEELIGSES